MLEAISVAVTKVQVVPDRSTAVAEPIGIV